MRRRLPFLSLESAEIGSTLRKQQPGSVHLIALSNVVEAVGVDVGDPTLRAASTALGFSLSPLRGPQSR